MRVTSWNVNSIRTRIDRVVAWIATHRPDVLLVQETKCTDEVFASPEIGGRLRAEGYDVAHHGFDHWNGVAIVSRVGQVLISADHLNRHVVLAYATTLAGVQGRTTERGHILVTPATTASSLYVGMTRGRACNTPIRHDVALATDLIRERFVALASKLTLARPLATHRTEPNRVMRRLWLDPVSGSP